MIERDPPNNNQLKTICFILFGLLFFFGIASRVSIFEKHGFESFFAIALLAGSVFLFILFKPMAYQKYSLFDFCLCFSIVLIILASLRNFSILKNAILFWTPLILLLIKRYPNVSDIIKILDLIWWVVLFLTLLDVFLIFLGGSIFDALWGDSFKLVFSERTWTSLLFSMYGTYFLSNYNAGIKNKATLRLKVLLSFLIAFITLSFSTVLSSFLIVPFVLIKSSVTRGVFICFSLSLLYLISQEYFHLIEFKFQNRLTAFMEELSTIRHIEEVMYGFIYNRPVVDYSDLPGVPDVGLNSFTLPFFILNNFGFMGAISFLFLSFRVFNNSSHFPVFCFFFFVAFIHPSHLQLEFLVLLVLMCLSGLYLNERPIVKACFISKES